jgi:alpha-soluble NSF attachment protein
MATAMMERARKKEAGFTVLGVPIPGTSSEPGETAQLYEKAAYLYKMDKLTKEAGEAFKKAAENYLNSDSPIESATAWVSASNCFKKEDPTEAIACLQRADTICREGGRILSSARIQETIAKIYEDQSDNEKAYGAYTAAAELFLSGDSISWAVSCLVPAANLAAKDGKLDQAISAYENLANFSLPDRLLRWKATTYLFSAAICCLAKGDIVAAENAIERYENMDASFERSREATMLHRCIEALNRSDIEGFTTAVREYDCISRLDDWKTRLLLRVKNQIRADVLEGGPSIL